MFLASITDPETLPDLATDPISGDAVGARALLISNCMRAEVRPNYLGARDASLDDDLRRLVMH
jgi:hypothetical protein